MNTLYCKYCKDHPDHSIEETQTPVAYLEIITCEECDFPTYKEVTP